MNQAIGILELKAMWVALKAKEDETKASRLEVENLILNHFPKDKTEGSICDADAGVTVSYKMTRTVDSDALNLAWNSLSANAQKAFKVKFDVDLKNYRAINDLDPVSFSEVSKFVTSKPAKPSISVKD